jgi:ATP-dependent helicase/nuclease subunit B
MSTTANASVFTVSPGRPFLHALATAILQGDLPRSGGRVPSPIDLAGYTLLLPTRRATRALQNAFLDVSGGAAMLLPKIRPIAEGQEDLGLLTGSVGLTTLGTDATDIPPAISEIERRLVLTRLVLRWSEAMRSARAASGDSDLATYAAAGAGTPAQAANLAAELARLIDMVETEGATLDGLAALVPDEYAEHWGQTLQFLEIVTQYWPAYLSGNGQTSAADRRNKLILAEANRLTQYPPAGPVIVAGVSGSIPATAALMKVVAGLPQGAIVLPALDRYLDDPTWSLVREGHPEHPQFGLTKLLAGLDLQRGDVTELGGHVATSATVARLGFISAAMRPAAATASWHAYTLAADKTALAKSLETVNLIEAPTAQDEAEVIALILREALEVPGRTAALVSPDRMLARRVGIRLRAWGIELDDSAGRPFAKTVPGAFINLVADAAATDFEPAAVTALLKHPLMRLGLPAVAVRRAARVLELAAFRATYLGQGLEGVELALERTAQDAKGGARVHRAVKRLWDEDWTTARDLVQRLKLAFAPMVALAHRKDVAPLRELVAAHIATVEALARTDATIATEAGSAVGAEDTPITSPVWDGEAGTAGSLFFTSLLDPDLAAPDLAPADYPDFYRSLISGENVRGRIPVHPRLSIWGPFEARLQQPDIVILGSLNEATWPEAADPGPWLNRPMRAALGLPSPEEKIGYAAHDFTSLLGAERVYLTRSQKVDGNPAVPSRWLMRITALLEGLNLRDALKPQQPWLAWARARDMSGKHSPVKAPAPTPPVALRPRKLSVTAIETWMANPYAIFAGYVLGLEPLAELGREPDASLKGQMIHDALGRFAAAHPERLPTDIEGELMRHVRDVLRSYQAHPRVAAFWMPRFERFAHWFANTEAGRRSGTERVLAEISGAEVLSVVGQPFTLTARADRIDIAKDGLIITDYKTGQAPSDSRVLVGTAPQLSLEAAIALAGGFANVPQRNVRTLSYIRVTGGEPPGETRIIKTTDVASLAASVRGGLIRLINEFDQSQTPYRALRRADFADHYRYDGFAHLARVAEWSGIDVGED